MLREGFGALFAGALLGSGAQNHLIEGCPEVSSSWNDVGSCLLHRHMLIGR